MRNELLRSGATIADVQRLLGHASIKTTSVYLASDQQRQEDVSPTATATA